MHRMFRWFGLSVLACLALTLLAFSTFAQWPVDTEQNLAVTNQLGEETTPKVIAAMDGGCYVAWFENLTGSYTVKMQRYDADGIAQWGENGMLVSDHNQLSWITDYSVAVDGENNVYIAFNDVRHSTAPEPDIVDWDIFIYKISPDGTFLWGDDGLALTDNSVPDLVPRLLLTWEGDVVVAWERGAGSEDQETFDVVLHKIDANGADLWDPVERVIPGGENMARPLLVESDNGFFVQYLLGAAGERVIYVQSFDDNGDPQWTNPAEVCQQGDIPVWSAPLALTDYAGGVFTVWYEAVGFVQSRVFVQHVDADGNVMWGDDGMLAVTDDFWNEHSPDAKSIMLMGGSGLAVFFGATDGTAPTGVRGQYIQLSGTRAWGDSGLTVVETTAAKEVGGISVDLQGGMNFLCSYLWMDTQDMSDVQVKATCLTMAGEFIWPDTSVVMSNAYGGKGALHLATSTTNRGIVVWQDGRNGIINDPGIYLHTVEEDGGTGATQLSVLAPANDHGYRELPLNVMTLIRGFNLGREGSTQLLITGPGGDSFVQNSTRFVFPIDSLYEGMNDLTFSLVDPSGLPLDPPVERTLRIGYTPAADLNITWPEPEVIIDQLPLTVDLGLNGFELGTHGVAEVTVFAGENEYRQEIFSSEPVVLDDLPELENRIIVRLLGNDREELTPGIADTVDFYYEPASGVEEDLTLPAAFALESVHPNPFNASTVIRYEVPFEQPVRIAVYDLLGREVARLVDHRCIAGRHTVSFDGRSQASGVYFVRMSAPSYSAVQRMVLIK